MVKFTDESDYLKKSRISKEIVYSNADVEIRRELLGQEHVNF